MLAKAKQNIVYCSAPVAEHIKHTVVETCYVFSTRLSINRLRVKKLLLQRNDGRRTFLFIARCLLEHGPGPKACFPQGNRCSCDFQLVLGAAISAMKCGLSGKSECVKAAASITVLFSSVLSCWFPTKICFPSVKVVCRCSACSCPSLKTVKICVPFKFCVPFGSGKVYW